MYSQTHKWIVPINNLYPKSQHIIDALLWIFHIIAFIMETNQLRNLNISMTNVTHKRCKSALKFSLVRLCTPQLAVLFSPDRTKLVYSCWMSINWFGMHYSLMFYLSINITILENLIVNTTKRATIYMPMIIINKVAQIKQLTARIVNNFNRSNTRKHELFYHRK